ncbi:HAD family hydrolase [Pseudoruegeria sp. SK021]|uniref:HAD family hydrolase n=1 Tax=Pseudoruegeria sp. SK021 TaxID=1933035 RepID=UPI000A254726|nr:HAD family hydrolase [Pseudoruegeria sp. SK021]OSP54305.1 hypothetical protein BV911_13100 [Pseudoruegeria sp. SK021]
MTRISAILFDKDGTLFDYHKTWALWSRDFLAALAENDPALTQRLADVVDFDIEMLAFRPDSILVSATPHDIARTLLPQLPGASMAGIVTRMSAMSADLEQAEATPLLPLMQGLLSRGLRLGVATNDCEAPARSHLGSVGIQDMFDHILGCDSGYSPKPSPEMLLAFCDRTDLQPAEVVMVGDSWHDMSAARDAGMVSIAVLTGIARRAQLSPLADVVLPSIAALPQWLDGVCATESAA